MVAYTYSRVSALNFNTTPASVAKSATGQVYAIADTTFTTPLTVTMVVGGTAATSLSSDANGFFPDFTVADRTSVVWKQNSSSFTTVLTTTDPVPGAQGSTGAPGTPGVKGDRGDLATWQTNTFYPLNQIIANPSGDLVKVTTAHTSGTTYDGTKFGWVNNNAANLTGLLPEASVPTRLTAAELGNTYATIGAAGLYVDSKLVTSATAAANTSALNTAMSAASTLGATVFIPAGTYSLNSVSITAPLRGAGRAATLLNGVRLIYAGNNVTISELKFHSTDPVALSASAYNDLALVNAEVSHDAAVTAPLGFSLTNVQRLRISGCKFGVGGVQFSTVNDFVYDGNYTDAQYLNTNEPLHISQQSSGVVTGSTFKNTLTDAIDLYSSGEYCAITSNRFYGLKGASGIECKVTMTDDVNNTSGPGNVIDGVVIANNILRDFIPQNAGNARCGIYAEFVDSRTTPTYAVSESNRALIITGNVLEDFNVNDPGFAASYSGIIFTGHNGLVTNNVIRNMRSWTTTPVGVNLAWSVAAQKAAGVRVSGNIIAGIEEGIGIQSGNMDRCQISDNIIRRDDVSGRATKHGLNVLAGATLNHCTIEGNTFACNTATSYGLQSTAATTTWNRCIIQGNMLKDCGVSIAVAHYCSFVGNSMDNGTNSQSFSVGVTGTSLRGNIYSGNHITMSADYALSLVDHDGFVITSNTFNNTARAVLLNGATKNGVIDNNISITQTLGAEFPHYSGVIAGDQATITVGANKVLA